MFGRDKSSQREIVAQLRELAELLRRDIQARLAQLSNMKTFMRSDERAKQQEEHKQNMERIKQEGEMRRAEQDAQHTAWLAAMEKQTAVLARIAEKLDQLGRNH